ncbi:DNA alkylation repair protein [Gordonia polyisoprenivorans]|uniref:DNA alkylation repair protein n=1 Tax=Gordonia polyisoprenivorans TaxID=84595 RepID=UPI001AD7BDA7|nr:DNA alkylation repair protein [Gordonia polyisoprenivorans]QTI68231.1 DNA alkylation repair protein [Gordonia polyisoprenivorans]
MDSVAAQVIAEVGELGDAERAAGIARYLQARPGGYGEGDEFVGVAVPQLRVLARRWRGIDRSAVGELLSSPIHEIRFLALLLMAQESARADDADARAWVADYRRAVDDGYVNNWDLVDTSAAPVLGHWCVRIGDHTALVDLAADERLWHRRVGIVGTHAHLREGDAGPTLAVAPLVIDDRRDLIQKALGWMLREMGKRVERSTLTDYLDAHAASMGRTALRYAIEHLDPAMRAGYRAMR